MINYFDLLTLSPSPRIDQQKLDDHYKRLAADTHPDKGGDEKLFNELNVAYKALRYPSSRVKHLLEINAIDYNKRGTVSNDLMNFFMSTGNIIQQADALITKKQQATSILSKALLEPQSLELQEGISKQIDDLEQAQARSLDRLPEEINASLYETAARDLSFLEKWQSQLKERYASLF